MVLPEVVVIGRLVEFYQPDHTGHATQSLLMLGALDDIDAAALARLAAQKRVEDVLAFFRALAAAPSHSIINDAFYRTKRDEIQQERQRVAAECRAQREGGDQGAGSAGCVRQTAGTLGRLGAVPRWHADGTVDEVCGRGVRLGSVGIHREKEVGTPAKRRRGPLAPEGAGRPRGRTRPAPLVSRSCRRG